MTEQLVAGRYRPLEQLRGATWLGHDDQTGDKVVLRFHEPSTGRWLRLLHEAEALRLLGGLEYLDRQVLVRGYVEGPTLAERLLAGPLPVSEALAVARAALAELGRLHERGLLHGDLKPANLVMSDPPRLIDLAGEGGSPLYLAPELAGTVRRRLGPWTDLYSLGICLFEMLTGKPPFLGTELSELLRLHLSATPASCGHPRLDAILARLLAKAPEERYQTAGAVAHDLEHLPAVVGATDRRETLASPGFVGRQEELNRLTRAASDGERRLVVLEAPPGGGKTRLLEELQLQVVGDQRWCLRGQVATLSSPVPLGLFAEVVGEAVARAEVIARLGPLGGVLAEAFPEIREHLPHHPISGETGDQGAAALAQLLEALGKDAVVLLDDVQWADPVSLEALARWARVQGPGALVIAACRSGELPRPLGQHAELQLPPLGAADLRALWASMAGQAWDTPELERLEDLCEGNPFLAIEGLRGLRETGELTSARGSALLQQRLKGLSSLPVLGQAALVGKRFPLELLVELAGAKEASRALAEARGANVLWVGDDTAEFAHDRLRDAAAAVLEQTDRSAVHRQAAEWFGRQGDSQAQAYHAHACGDPEAPRLALEVARRLKGTFALGESLQFYAIALDGSSDLEVRLERGNVYALVGFHREARADYEKVLSSRPDLWLRARTLFQMGELEYRQNRMREAVPHFEEALRTLGLPVARLGLSALLRRPEIQDERTSRFGLRVYLRISDALGHAGEDLAGLVAAQVLGAKLAGRHPLIAEAGVIMANVGTVLAHFGSRPQARRYFQRALAATAAVPASLERARVLSRVSIDGLRERDPRQAIAYLEQAVSLLESLAEDWELNMARFVLASLYRAQGRLEETQRLAADIVQTSARANVAHHIWQARAFLLQCGDPDQPLAGEAPGSAALCFQAVTRGLSELHRGHPQEALSGFLNFRPARLLVDADRTVLLVWTATAARMCAEECAFEAGAARAEFYRQARRAAREAIQAARSFRCYLPHALREAALLAQARGHVHRARLLFAASLEEAEFFPLEAARTRRAMDGQSNAQVYDLAPPQAPASTPRRLRSLVDWSGELLTSPTRADLRARLEAASRELLSGTVGIDEDCQIVGELGDVAIHLNRLARSAGENLLEEEKRRQASVRLEASQRRLQEVLDSAGVALALVDKQGCAVAQNALFADLGELAEPFLERLKALQGEELREQGPWLSGLTASWCARRSEAGAVITVTPAQPERLEALARFQESERRLVAARLGAVAALLAGYPEQQAAFDTMRYDLRADLASAPDLATRLRLVARDIDLEVEMPSQLPLSDLGQIALERILCEGIHNAVRHGQPGRLEVKVQVEGHWVVASLSDDGQGFQTGGESGRRGLKGMCWRAELVGGTLEVRSSPRRGTTLELRLPCAQTGAPS